MLVARGSTLRRRRPSVVDGSSASSDTNTNAKCGLARYEAGVAYKRGMSESAKRSIQVNVRLSEQDFDLIKKASAKLWPNAVLTNSGVLLGLARLAAKRVLDRPRGQKSSERHGSG